MDSSECIKCFPVRDELEFFIQSVGYHDFHTIKPYLFNRIQKYFTVHFILSGSGLLNINGQKYPVHKHEVFVVEKDCIFSYYPSAEDPWEYIWFVFDGTSAKDFIRHLGFSESEPVKSCNMPQKLRSELSELFEKIEKQISVSYFSALSVLYLLFASVEEKTENIFFHEDDYVEEVKRFIEVKYLNENFSIEYLCAMLHISHSHLCRVFRTKEGVSVVSYINALKMTKAEELLKKTSLTVKEISYMCGFKEYEYFFSMFKKIHSVTPLQYRKQKSGL